MHAEPVALVLLVLIRGWAGRTMVIGAAVLLLTPTFAVRQQIGSIPIENPEPLCTGGVDGGSAGQNPGQPGDRKIRAHNPYLQPGYVTSIPKNLG